MAEEIKPSDEQRLLERLLCTKEELLRMIMRSPKLIEEVKKNRQLIGRLYDLHDAVNKTDNMAKKIQLLQRNSETLSFLQILDSMFTTLPSGITRNLSEILDTVPKM